MGPSLCLASTSRYRQNLLRRLHFPFEVSKPTCDENQLKKEFLTRRNQLDENGVVELAAFLSRHKAQSALTNAKFVIGSDQICFFDGKTLSKPGSLENARITLKQLQGNTHLLVTAVAIWNGTAFVEWTNIARFKMKALSDSEIEKYLAADSPLDCAGSYKLEAGGIALMQKIECEDWTAIEGLPLIKLNQVLLGLGLLPFSDSSN